MVYGDSTTLAYMAVVVSDIICPRTVTRNSKCKSQREPVQRRNASTIFCGAPSDSNSCAIGSVVVCVFTAVPNPSRAFGCH